MERKSSKSKHVVIDKIKVDKKILVKPYECDVKKLDCPSLCCQRGCVITNKEIKRLNKHLPGIMEYLTPKKREWLKKNGTYVADCEKQCPDGCDIGPEEKRAVSRIREKREKIKCISYDKKGCFFLYDKEGAVLCAVHSYALDNGIGLEEVKPMDCIQYPIYFYHTKKHKRLSVQKGPLVAELPCMNIPCGDAMYKNLTNATRNLVGEEFSKKLHHCAEKLK